MALDPATVAEMAKAGVEIYNFVSGLFGEDDTKPDFLEKIDGLNKKLDQLGDKVTAMGVEIARKLDETGSYVVDEIANTVLAQLGSATLHIREYRNRYNGKVPFKYDTGNPDLHTPLNSTFTALTFYHLNGTPNTPQDHVGNPAYMPGLMFAQTKRLEFAEACVPCWHIRTEEPFIAELRASVDRIRHHLTIMKNRVGPEFQVTERTILKKNINSHGATAATAELPVMVPSAPKDPLPPPEPKNAWVEVTVTDGFRVYYRFGAPESDLKAADEARKKGQVHLPIAIAAKRAEAFGRFDAILGLWEDKIKSAKTTIQSALAGAALSSQAAVSGASLTGSDLLSPTASEAAGGEAGQALRPSGRALSSFLGTAPRNLLLDVLTSSVMKARHPNLTNGASARGIRFWTAAGLSREPQPDEMEILHRVADKFGLDAVMACLVYSRQYTEASGHDLPLSPAILKTAMTGERPNGEAAAE